MAESTRQIRVFVSSPGDARFERSRLERVVERLNGEFQGLARLTTIRWETEFYKAHDTFQAQIPEAAQCDIVMAIFRGRLGTELPPDFPLMADGKPYPSGTAYEVLSAIDASKGRGLPDVYVFRCPQPPLVQLDDPKEVETKAQWEHLKTFFENWFVTSDGQFKAAFQTFSTTDDFEAQAEALLRKWLEEKVLHGRSVTWPVELKGSPFRGLAAFGAKHATVFFGRGRDIAKATDQLKDAAEKNCAFLLVDGASGSGKSSLVRAGMVSRLAAAGVVPSIDVWRCAIMRPGEAAGDPFAALARALFVGTEDLPDDEQGRLPALPELGASDFTHPEELAGLLGHADDTVLRPIVGTLTAIERSVRKKEGFDRDVKAALLLVVDQLDELFDVQIAEDVRARFATLLGLLARSGRIWIIATLRADLFDRFLGQPALKQLKEDGASYDLAPPDVVELAEIVRGPAAAADLVYETDSATGERLDERLLKDAGRPDLLPLLQFTLNQLFEARETADHRSRLTFAAYRTLGGLEGAVDKEAESAVQALGEAEQARLPRLLRELAAPAADGGVNATRASFEIRSVPLADAAYDEVSGKLVRSLVDARILLSSGQGSQATVRLAHARVLDSWQRAKTIVTENADFFRIRAQVEEQRRRWQATGRSRDLLIGRGRPLAEAESIVRRFPEEIPVATRDFVKRSGRRARLVQTLTAVAALLFAAVAVAAAYSAQQAFRAQKEAEGQRQRAEQALATTTQLANSLVFETMEEFRLHGLTQEARKMSDRMIQSYDQVIKIDPTAAAYTGRGAAYYNKGDFDHAIADYSQAITLDPGSAAAYSDRGTAYSDKGDLDHAIADYDQAITIDSKYIFAYYNRGNAYRDKGDLDRAIADYGRAIALDPKLPDAYNGRGNAYRDKGDLDHAIADYSQVIMFDPKYALAYSNRGNAFLDRRDYDHAIADFDQAITLNPKYAVDYAGLGLAYSGKGDFDRAIAEFDQAITLDPKSVIAYNGRGYTYYLKGDFDHATADFNQVITLDPKFAYAFYNRGNVYRDKSDLDDAIADYSQAINLKPNYTDAFLNRGRVYTGKGDLDHAIADFDQAITLNPNFASAYNDRGYAYDREKDFDHAIADYNQAIALDPKLVFAYVRRGDTYFEKGDFDQAIADLGQALAIDPKNVAAYVDRGSAYTEKSEIDRAIADYDQAIALDPNNANAYNGRCWARVTVGRQLQQALADCSESLRIRPNIAEALDSRGFAYFRLGRLDAAIADFDAALAINPKLASSLYGRGLAKLKKGDRAGADADMAAAKAIKSDIAEQMAGFGIT